MPELNISLVSREAINRYQRKGDVVYQMWYHHEEPNSNKAEVQGSFGNRTETTTASASKRTRATKGIHPLGGDSKDRIKNPEFFRQKTVYYRNLA